MQAYKINRKVYSLVVAEDGTVQSVIVPDSIANGLLRGIIITVPAFDTTLFAVSDTEATSEFVFAIPDSNPNVNDTEATSEFISVMRNNAWDVKVNDSTVTSENVVA